jgi:hypothetical protein
MTAGQVEPGEEHFEGGVVIEVVRPGRHLSDFKNSRVGTSSRTFRCFGSMAAMNCRIPT